MAVIGNSWKAFPKVGPTLSKQTECNRVKGPGFDSLPKPALAKATTKFSRSLSSESEGESVARISSLGRNSIRNSSRENPSFS
jgi:hypothetical protein